MSNPNITTMIIRHMSGSKKGQTERFPVRDRFEIRIGRGPANDVTFDPVKEDAISREHCRIVQDEVHKDQYTVIDCQSKNGTYVNDRLITEKTQIMAGDIVRLGKEGPSMEFDLDPRPASHVKKTRVMETPVANPTKTHEASKTAEMKVPQKEAIGKATMQHMIQQTEKKNKVGLAITIIAILLVVGTGGWVLYKNQSKLSSAPVTPAPKDMGVTPAQIAKANEDKVVFIEMGWKLTITQTGEELYHVYAPVYVGKKIVDYKAAYIRNNQGITEPYLSTKSAAPIGSRLEPIGGFGTGSGFVVSEQGFIITNRHVAAPWLTAYQFPATAFPGILMEPDANGVLHDNLRAYVTEAEMKNWVPAEAMNYNRQLFQSGIKMIDGASAYMDVTFANNSLRTPAKIVRISNSHDVAMVKIDLPEALAKVTMFDNYKEIAPGNSAVVMGYPALSPDQYIANRSQDYFNRNPNIVKVPVPTISTGNIGRLVRGRESGKKVDEYLNTMGDYYQLTINSTGAGNSGGPMFDDQGRVIGIYSAGNSTLSFAIPIKYAIELMGRQEVLTNN